MPWTPCTKTCNGGVSERRRKCEFNSMNEPCYGKDKQSKICNRRPCVTTTEQTTTTEMVSANWNQWMAWTTCTRSCGGGMQYRKRTCQGMIPNLTLTRPLRRKLRMRWFFDIFLVKESSFFFKSDLTDPSFLMRIFWKLPI